MIKIQIYFWTGGFFISSNLMNRQQNQSYQVFKRKGCDNFCLTLVCWRIAQSSGINRAKVKSQGHLDLLRGCFHKNFTDPNCLLQSTKLNIKSETWNPFPFLNFCPVMLHISVFHDVSGPSLWCLLEEHILELCYSGT